MKRRKAGRPRKAGARYPSGDIRPSLNAQRLEAARVLLPVFVARCRRLGITVTPKHVQEVRDMATTIPAVLRTAGILDHDQAGALEAWCRLRRAYLYAEGLPQPVAKMPVPLTAPETGVEAGVAVLARVPADDADMGLCARYVALCEAFRREGCRPAMIRVATDHFQVSDVPAIKRGVAVLMR